MAKSKVLSKAHSFSGAKGGSTSMLKRQFTGQQPSGVTSQEPKKESGGFAKGGSTKMFGKQSVKPAKAC